MTLYVQIALRKCDVGPASSGEGDKVTGGDVAFYRDDLSCECLIHDYLDQSRFIYLLEVVDLEQFEIIDEMLGGVIALHTIIQI